MSKTTKTTTEPTAEPTAGGTTPPPAPPAAERPAVGAYSDAPVTPESLVESSVEAVFGTLPLGLSPTQSAAAATRLARVAVRQPRKVVQHTAHLWWEQAKVLAGTSDVEPDPRDRRFADEDWTTNPVYRRLAQSYLAWNEEVYALLDDYELDDKSKERARFLLGLITETLSPSNTILGNPTVAKRAWKTRGRSLVDGVRHLAYDVRNNGGLPSMVDTRPFTLGENIAATPGQVVFRNEVLELIQYTPTTETVHERPLLFIPPQINRFYILDLAPERSLVEHAVANGQQVFMVSWRNVDAEMRDWDLDTYCAALLEALDATIEITGADDVNLTGVCAGGITSSSLLGHLAAIGDTRINSASFLVTVLDWSVLSTVGTFISRPMVAAAIQTSRRKGILDGRELARLFAWLRPNDLIWNYWINNYLLGENPPVFDVLAWNVDSTNLPAALHADFMDMASGNLMTTDGGVEVLGTPINLAKVQVDSYVVGAVNDHITPWEGCYETTRILGGDSRFVLSNAGHIVAMVNPPGSRKSAYRVNPDGAGLDPAAWKAGSTEHQGTWWDDWMAWLAERSGAEVEAPRTPGSEQNPAILAAPGSYVRA